MRGLKAKIASCAVAAALVASSTATGAASLPAPAQPVGASQAAQSSWLALSMMTQGGAIGLAGAAAQPDGAALPPPPPPPPRGYGSVQTPPIPVIAVWLATVAMAIYIATIDHRGHGQFPLPNSAG
jgi:hypothetical protein